MTTLAAVDHLEASAAAADTFDADAEAKRLEAESGPGLARVYLDGKGVDASVADAVTDADVAETMDGASTFTVTLFDPEDELLNSPLFNRAVLVKVDDDLYELVNVQSHPPILTLVFEDADVARMRRVTKPRKARRSKTMTRIAFIIAMVRETRGRRIPVFAPERGPQPIGRTEPRKEKAKRKREHRNGFPRGADIEVKGERANSSQLRVLDDVLEQGTAQRANTRCLIGGVIAVTGESAARNLSGGDRDSVGAFQQRRSQGWPATRHVKRDAREFFRRLIPLERQYGHARDIGWLVDQVQRSQTFNTSRQGADYQKWLGEAEHTVDTWTGGGGGASGTGRRKPFVFRRGQPGEREDTWTAAGRLMEEVRWHRFMRRGTLWLVREDWLIGQPARMILTRRSPGVQRIEVEWDAGKKVNRATVTLLASYAAVLPGDRIDLTHVGRGSGKYLVSTVTRRRFSPLVSVDLKRTVHALPEPLGETVSTRRSSGTGGGSGTATGKLQWPVSPHPITSGFGHRSSPGGVGSTNHDGIDIGVGIGTVVHAADGGKVVKAGPNGGYGNYVEIDHGNGLHTFYGHLSRISVRSGQAVDKGDTIARSGNSGHSTGPHLHFGTHKNGAAVDPRKYL